MPSITNLVQGIGATRDEIERALGEREYVLDGRSYYLDGSTSVRFDGGVTRELSVTYHDSSPSMERVNDVLNRLRPDDARPVSASTETGGSLLKVFESDAIRDAFGEGQRYVEQVRLDPATGETIGFTIAVE